MRIALFIFFLIGLLATPALAVATPPSPYHQWKFDGDLRDTGTSSTRYDLASNGTPLYTSDTGHLAYSRDPSFGQSLNLTDQDQWLRNSALLDNVQTEYGSTGMAIEIWYRRVTQADPGTLFSKYTGPGDYLYLQYRDGAMVCEVARDNVSARSGGDGQPAVDPSGEIAHYVLNIYPNGTVEAYGNYHQYHEVHPINIGGLPRDSLGSGSNFTVGSLESPDGAVSAYWKDSIIVLRIYRQTLSDSDVHELYWKGARPPATGSWENFLYLWVEDRTITLDRQRWEIQRHADVCIIDSTIYFATGAEEIYSPHPSGIYEGDFHLNQSRLVNLNASRDLVQCSPMSADQAYFVDSLITGVEICAKWTSPRDIYIVNTRFERITQIWLAGRRGPSTIWKFENVSIYDPAVNGLWVMAPYSNREFRNVNITMFYHKNTPGVDAGLKIEGRVQNCTFRNFRIVGGKKPAPSWMLGPGLLSWLGPSWMLWPHHGVLMYWPAATNNTILDSYIAHCGNGYSNYADAGCTNYVRNTVFYQNEDAVDGGAGGDGPPWEGVVQFINCTFERSDDFQSSLQGDQQCEYHNCTIKDVNGFILYLEGGTAKYYNTLVQGINADRLRYKSLAGFHYMEWTANQTGDVVRISVNQTATENVNCYLLQASYGGPQKVLTAETYVPAASRGEYVVDAACPPYNITVNNRILAKRADKAAYDAAVQGWYWDATNARAYMKFTGTREDTVRIYWTVLVRERLGWLAPATIVACFAVILALATRGRRSLRNGMGRIRRGLADGSP